MKTLYATCGLAFSGKTTVAKQLAATLDISRVSLDDINSERGLDAGIGMSDTQWEETSAIAVQRLTQILSTGISVVLDDTLSHRFLRDRYRAVADDAQACFRLLYMDTPPKEIDLRIARNRSRPHRSDIRADVFEAHQRRFQHPGDDEKPIRLASRRDIETFLASLAQR
ncbi:MAG: ATP-binding protein [Pseudomonadota bacterium]